MAFIRWIGYMCLAFVWTLFSLEAVPHVAAGHMPSQVHGINGMNGHQRIRTLNDVNDQRVAAARAAGMRQNPFVAARRPPSSASTSSTTSSGSGGSAGNGGTRTSNVRDMKHIESLCDSAGGG